MRICVNQTRVELMVGDITLQDTESIVNAANSYLKGGLGVDGAIHSAGGAQILAECLKIGGCPTGEARITSGGKLRAKYVIHAVGPRYTGGKRGEADLLAGAYQNSLHLARSYGIKSIAFPSISTGAYGYPLNQAAPIALRTVLDDLKLNPGISLVRFVLFKPEISEVYQSVLTALIRQDP